jgi:hypothetical protein
MARILVGRSNLRLFETDMVVAFETAIWSCSDQFIICESLVELDAELTRLS